MAEDYAEDVLLREEDASSDFLSAKVEKLETNMVKVTDAVTKLTQFIDQLPSLAALADTAKGRKRTLSDSSAENMDTMDSDPIDDESDVRSLMASAGEKEDTSKKDDAAPAEEALLDRIDAEYSPDEPRGPALHEKLANIVTKRMENPLAADLIKKKEELFPRPSNCEVLAVPKVNAEIWRKMDNAQKGRDLRFSHAQRAVVKATTGVATMADKLLNFTSNEKGATVTVNKADLEKLVVMSTDVVSLLGFANRDLAFRRRELIRPALKSQFAPLCADSTPMTSSWLFGDNIHQTLTKVKQADQVGKETSSSFLAKGNYRHNRFKEHGKRRWGKQQDNQQSGNPNWKKGRKDQQKH